MSNKEKLDLQWHIRYMLGQGKTDSEIVERLKKDGYHKDTIKKFLKAFSK